MEQSEYLKNRNRRDIIFIILLIAFLVILILMYFQVKSDDFKCAQNPLSFGYSLLKEHNKYSNIYCSCSLSQFGKSAILVFNENESNFLDKNQGFGINLSK